MSSPLRKLSAIMFTDIAGYTAMMGEDEQLALDLLRQSRELQKDRVSRFNGKWLKEMGDGVLSEFPSALDAVMCARSIQEDAGNLQHKIRIGIHLGDVTVENDDIFGDGVNIASRLQAAADPGGVFFSESVQKAIKSQKDIEHQLVGNILLKNVDEPVTTYCLKGPGVMVPTAARIRALTSPAERSAKKRIKITLAAMVVILLATAGYQFGIGSTDDEIGAVAVLPVENLTGNADLDYFASGIHASIIDELSRIRNIRVPSRSTSVQFANRQMTLPEIASELQVDAVVEASLFEVSENVRLRVALVDVVPEERTLWNREFDREMTKVLSIYNEVTREIAMASGIILSENEKKRLANTPDVNPEAYQAFLKGMMHWFNATPEDLDKALEYFEFAIEKDADYPAPYTGIAKVWGGRVQQGIMPGADAAPKVSQWLEKAMELDSNDVEVQFTLAITSTWWKWDWEMAGRAFRKTLELDPGHTAARAYYSHYLHVMGQPVQAMEQIEMVIERDPVNTLFRALYGMDLNFSRQYNKAREILEKALVNAPNDPIAISNLRSTYHHLKEYDKAIRYWKRFYELSKDEEAITALEEGYRMGGYEEALNQLAELMIVRSKEKYVPPWRIATMYTRAGNKEKAMEYLWKAFEAHDANMPYISCDPIFDFMRDDPIFQELLKAMKLDNVDRSVNM